ncbi:MAG TPA: SCP2 sterol-binding domain-containing protein [Pilimelia sp.]|nr:SCP2 sterol-binding domain-containing protein [Pilimelia sp.]
MGDAATVFFRELADSGYQPLLRRAEGSIRFELDSDAGTASWLVTISHGVPAVSRRKGRADCVVRAEQALFNRLVTGEANMMAAMLRGQVTTTQERPELLVLFQRFMRARQHRRSRDAAPGDVAGRTAGGGVAR